MQNKFNDMGISPPILKALKTMGFVEPTEVQEKAIPHALEKKDLIVRSKTGSGKTAVFGISMLQLIDPSEDGPQGLILTPTRELAMQVNNDIREMARHLPHRVTAVYGQHNMNSEIDALQKGAAVVAGTPGRVFDHVGQGNLITKHIRFLVLDEADRMLDMGFMEQVVRIIKTLPKDRVTMLFSATIPPEINHICHNFMKYPVNIETESSTMTVSTTQQNYYRVKHNEKNTWLNRLLLLERPESCIIFCNTRARVDRVQHFLFRQGYACRSLHGDIPQSRRSKTMQQFKRGAFSLLVATDVAARGIHVDDLSLVINYDIPVEKDSYVHRIGRTGRAGSGGRAISLVTSDDIMSLYEIEEHIGVLIAKKELPTEADYNQQRAQADQWRRENAKKISSLRVHSGAKSIRTGRQPSGSRGKSQQPSRQQRQPQTVGSRGNKRHDNSPKVSKQEHASARRQQQHKQTERSRPPISSAPAPKAEAVNVQSAPAKTMNKKPFLSRILTQIKTSFTPKRG